METSQPRRQPADASVPRLYVPYTEDWREHSTFTGETLVEALRASSTTAYVRYGDMRMAVSGWYRHTSTDDLPLPINTLTFDARRLQIGQTPFEQEHEALAHLLRLRTESEDELDAVRLPAKPGFGPRVVLAPDDGFLSRASDFRRATEDEEGVFLHPPLADPDAPVLTSISAFDEIVFVLRANGIDPTPDEVTDVLSTYAGERDVFHWAAKAVAARRAGALRAPVHEWRTLGRFDPDARFHEPYDSAGGYLAAG